MNDMPVQGVVFGLENHSIMLKYLKVYVRKSYVHLHHSAQKLRTSASLSTKVTYICITQHKS